MFPLTCGRVTSGRGNEWQGLRVAGVTSGRAFKICQYVSSWGTSHHAQFNTWNSQYVPCLSQAPIIAMFKSLLTQKNKGYLPLPSFKWYLFQKHYVCQNRMEYRMPIQTRCLQLGLPDKGTLNSFLIRTGDMTTPKCFLSKNYMINKFL